MHSFGLTERWLVLAEFPYVVNPLRLAFSGRPYIENYRWKPELGTRFHLFDRRVGTTASARSRPRRGSASTTSTRTRTATRSWSTSARSATPQIVEDLYMDRLRAGKPVSKPSLERFRISPMPGDGDAASG